MNWEQFLIDLSRSSQVVLVGPLLEAAFQPTGPTVYVDGGTLFRNHAFENGNFPIVSVGDGDSGTARLDKVLEKEKDYSDLAFVLRHLPDSIRHVELMGFLGGRRDHELINYGEVHHFLRLKKNFTTVRFDTRVLAFCGGAFNLEIHGSFSVVTFELATVFISGACKYSLKAPERLDVVSSYGLSNEGFGVVTFESIQPCFIFLG